MYKAWDMHSNTFVAVKEISLAQIPRELLGGIQVRSLLRFNVFRTYLIHPSNLPLPFIHASKCPNSGFVTRFCKSTFFVPLLTSVAAFSHQSEISLLQSLDHPRIVRYIDSIRAEKALYIVLEYVSRFLALLER